MVAQVCRASRLRRAALRSFTSATATFGQQACGTHGPEPLGRWRPPAAQGGFGEGRGVWRPGPAAACSSQSCRERDAEICAVCVAELPGWGSLARDDLRVERLPGGASNQNFKVQLAAPAAGGAGGLNAVLFRVYGSGLELLYDRELEVDIAQMLSRHGVAAQVYARGRGWRIEQWWHDAAPLLNCRMKEPAVLAQVASHIGRLHRMSAISLDFHHRAGARPPASLSRLWGWGRAAEHAALEAPRLTAGIALPEILAERTWLTDFVREGDDGVPGTGLDVVFSHWDPQENNILLTPSGLQFIDFEYSDMDHQAFDLATYFVECGIDLRVDEYPYYKSTPSELPTEDERRFFCAAYLTEYLRVPVPPGDPRAASLSRRTERFALAAHLLWAMWSVVRASRAPAGGFDYLHYGRCRWSLYRQAKSALLGKI
uniref:Choline kinase N-terminal domain-containing protein n=1 Tax=Alexandrium monilatum TaxID=311494 RepID=A0A7S4RP77_9DINO|mmetsp:Transcript_505/g.1704  ORF Transcript_505/g.1704 Transcript_505/m.1704 type:complete len:429 (-) Transcript_505:67-1353(-)